jgi:hypothetical protein
MFGLMPWYVLCMEALTLLLYNDDDSNPEIVYNPEE